MILPSDKGRATVLLDKQDYLSKAYDLLADKKTYTKLPKDPTPKYKKQLVAILNLLEQERIITTIKKKELYPTKEDPPKFYGLPKGYTIP